MKISTDRVLTTHTGSLPRPKALIDLILDREQGTAIALPDFEKAFEATTAKAVDDVVEQQVACGVDVVSDGEMSKASYTAYIRHRVSGIEPDPRAADKGRDIMIGRDLLEHPDFVGTAAALPPCRFPAASANCATSTAPRSTVISRISKPRRRRRSRPRCS